MVFNVLFLVFAVVALIESAPQALKKTIRDIPTGHCDPVCSCKMDSLYYSEGEQWAKPEDPCTVYRCSKNGAVKTIKKGCLYKGECHAVASTWNEGCNTFTCTENSISTFYKLTEAGCSLSTGGCLKVGERSHDGCDVLECQLDGQRMKTKKIGSGCAVDGACKKIGSYWHDGCSIITCANESSVAVKQTLKNEVMQWPDGNYALLKPKTGCPNDVPKVWSEGSRTHYGAGRNFYSKGLSLAGNYIDEYMRHNFCIHGTIPNSAQLPKYKTYWEPGSYCVLRRNGVCPRGFLKGYVAFDDNDSRSKSVSRGVLPDGVFTTKTGLHFCCRKDGNVKTEIVLPKKTDFVLFMEGTQTKCQTVKGMYHSVEFISFDGLLTSKHEKRGHAPSVKISEGDVILQLCHYKPKECGCLDESGQTITVNTEKEIDCVVKKCSWVNGKREIKIVSGGCRVNGTCQPVGYKWSVSQGDICRTRTCEKVFVATAKGPGTAFQITDSFPGCRDGDVCKNVGEEIHRDCYTSRCTKNATSSSIGFKVTKADCPWSGTCKAPNSTWEYNCMTYRCDMNTDSGHYRWNVQPVEYGCSDGKGNCYKVGENVSGQCFEAACQLSENKTVVFLDVTKGGCTWKDQCKDVNVTWEDGCHRFKCEWIDTNTGFTVVVNATDVSCEWNSTCYREDEVWFDGCIQYKCIISREAANVNWSVKTIGLGCKDFNGKCLPVGKEKVVNCVTYKCLHKGDRIGMNPVAVGCTLNNTCYSENEKWLDKANCVEYQCSKHVNPATNQTTMQVSVIGSGCLFNDTCMAVNSTWSDGCKTRKCIVSRKANMIHRSIAPISAGCDDEGICRNVGYKKITHDCRKYECIFNDTYKDSFFSLIGGACQSADGKCQDVGTNWTEKKQRTCRDYKCHKEQLGYVSRMIQQYCLDANGNCHDVGSSGFQADIKGRLHSNCSCILSVTQADNIEIHCK